MRPRTKARWLRVLGGLAVGAGLVALVGFGAAAYRDARFARARLLKARHPGNVLYESQYFAAFTIHAFLIGGAVAGGLLLLNGVGLFVLGGLVRERVSAGPCAAAAPGRLEARAGRE